MKKCCRYVIVRVCEDERMGARGSKTKSDISVEACVKKCAFAEPLDESTAHVPPREGVLKLVLKESGTSWTTTANDMETGELYFKAMVISSWRRLSKVENSEAVPIAYYKAKCTRPMQTITYVLRREPAFPNQSVVHKDPVDTDGNALYRFARVKNTQHFNNTAFSEAFLYKDGKSMQTKLCGKRIAGFRFFAYAYLVDSDGTTEVVVGTVQQTDPWCKVLEMQVAGGIDPMIVSCVLLSCKPGSSNGAGAGGWSGAGGGAY